MDAHKPVTLEEGDRYPLGPPEQTTMISSLTVVSDDELYRNFQDFSPDGGMVDTLVLEASA